MRFWPIAIVVLLTGCMGDSHMGLAAIPQDQLPPGQESDDPFASDDPFLQDEPLNCDAPTPGEAPMRRLSHVEYRYVLEDLFGNKTLAQQSAEALLSDPVSLGYSNSATLLDVMPVLGQGYMDNAEKIATTVVADLTTLGITCGTAPTNPTSCATTFIRSFVQKAYRRPVTAEQEQRYLTGFNAVRTAYDFKSGIEWIVATALQSPEFLYRTEPDLASDPDVRAVRPMELASRLSFFIWHSFPDAALLTAAQEGRLVTPEDVTREATRLLLDPKSARMLNFFDEWLDIDKGTYTRDNTVFPTLPGNLPDLFRSETRTFVRYVMMEGDRKLSTLLGASFTFANDALANHYGLKAPGSTSFVKVDLPAGRRGVWMQGGPLTAHDKTQRTSIVLRGLRVRNALLCQPIPSPPNDVDLTLAATDPNASQADRLAQHRTNATCASCHNMMDPVGQIFEKVDAVGRARTQDESGHTLTSSGELVGAGDATGTVASPDELMSRLSQSDDVRRCFSTQMFRYVHGREETPQDACSQKQAFQRFSDSGFDMRELVMGIVTSDDFLQRAVARNP